MCAHHCRLIWYKDNKELCSGDSYELRAENNLPTTTYKCVAVNCVGSAMSETVLKITSRYLICQAPTISLSGQLYDHELVAQL